MSPRATLAALLDHLADLRLEAAAALLDPAEEIALAEEDMQTGMSEWPRYER